MELEKQDNSSDRDMLYLMGGGALILLGAGLIMSNAKIRNTVTAALSSVIPELQGKLLPDFTAVGSDIKRYLKLKSM